MLGLLVVTTLVVADLWRKADASGRPLVYRGWSRTSRDSRPEAMRMMKARKRLRLPACRVCTYQYMRVLEATAKSIFAASPRVITRCGLNLRAASPPVTFRPFSRATALAYLAPMAA